MSLHDFFYVASKDAASSSNIVLQRRRSDESEAPSTTLRSLRELGWSPSPASRGRKKIYCALWAAAATDCAVWPNKIARSSAVRMPPWPGLIFGVHA
jgi:hypothetical protein